MSDTCCPACSHDSYGTCRGCGFPAHAIERPVPAPPHLMVTSTQSSDPVAPPDAACWQCVYDKQNHGPGNDHGWTPRPSDLAAPLDVERIAVFLHDEYGCRVTCRGGRLADDRHPSHNAAYLDQAKRLAAALAAEEKDG